MSTLLKRRSEQQNRNIGVEQNLRENALLELSKILKTKYENHPEVFSERLELRAAQEELERYSNFFDLGERDVLLEEIQKLRSQLPFYLEFSPKSSWKEKSLLQLTYYPCSPLNPSTLWPAALGRSQRGTWWLELFLKRWSPELVVDLSLMMDLMTVARNHCIRVVGAPVTSIAYNSPPRHPEAPANYERKKTEDDFNTFSIGDG
ncbi:hypothetical protein CQW23_17967 [Capsicum baccatum]|uniref:Uncharacterized protein n=1 Tax=Capsicum baccatum TaxID=33114 RepID=A0A2G2WFC8_CAPBA|nr:hypothetical protein CQW23_17967 [Capsicum baccatum]